MLGQALWDPQQHLKATGRKKCDPPDVVIITPAILLHDELGVIEHEGTEDKEAKVQVHLQAATDALTHTPMSFQMFLLALLTKGE